MKPPVKIPIEKLTEEPYASVLCYPRSDPPVPENRISELKELGVTAVEFTGSGMAANMPVLGKGYSGVVIIAYAGGERRALKIRRTDSGREDLFHEAEMLQKANLAGVGPKFMAASKNFLLSQLVDGGLLTKWLENHKEKAAFQRAIGDILEQCRRLDEAGLDHGELSRASGHLLTDKTGKPFIVDFGAASVLRKAANVTSVCQHLFIGNGIVQRMVEEVSGKKDKSQIVSALRDYKKERSENHFEALLQACL
ncbi:MAG: hypothetical protein FWE78_05840 [Methanimicrococcus sp.]|nr:hypothetical protein [Methanimicrococcus sp.]